MKVRVATLADAEAAAHVHWLASNTAYGRDDPFERRLETTREVLAIDGVHYFVAVDDGEVIGIATVFGNELTALYVHPDRWGGGAGQLLIERAHEELARAGGEAELTVLADNPRARRFYERNGWALHELVTEPHFGGVPTDVAKYRRRLEPPNR